MFCSSDHIHTGVFDQAVFCLHLAGPLLCVLEASSQIKQALITSSASVSHLLCASIVWKQTLSAFLSFTESEY